jgi:uncharacterized protein
VREITVGNIERIRRYRYLKNGAMYSVLFLGTIMLLESFGLHVPLWLSPIMTIGVVGFFFAKSWVALRKSPGSGGSDLTTGAHGAAPEDR